MTIKCNVSSSIGCWIGEKIVIKDISETIGKNLNTDCGLDNRILLVLYVLFWLIVLLFFKRLLLFLGNYSEIFSGAGTECHNINVCVCEDTDR